MSAYIAERTYEVESEREVDFDAAQLRREVEEKIAQYKPTIQPQRLWAAMSRFGDGRMILKEGNPPETLEYYRKLFDYSEHLWMDYADRIWEIRHRRLLQVNKQRGLADLLSVLSLSFLFSEAATAIAETDLPGVRQALGVSSDFWRRLAATGGISSSLPGVRQVSGE